jgi:hypothetical protein
VRANEWGSSSWLKFDSATDASIQKGFSIAPLPKSFGTAKQEVRTIVITTKPFP